jgi:hypothetical protein
LKNTIVTLNGVSEVGTFDAPKGEVTASGSINVTMCPDGNKAATTRTYQAVTVPHTKLEKDKYEDIREELNKQQTEDTPPPYFNTEDWDF